MSYPNVIDVKPIENYNLILTFDNGQIRLFDVKPYIKGNWFGELKDVEVFASVRPCGSTVEWKNGQDIAPHELYELSVDVA